MSSEGEFRSSEEEVAKLLEECSELRRTLKAISSQVARMETRVKAAFPIVAKRLHEKRGLSRSQKTSTLTSEQALSQFNRIVEFAKSGSISEAEASLESLSPPDLLFVAKELGLSFSSNKPSMRAMREAVLGRVRESILLSRHSPRL